jgi:hypothetical protein
MKYYQYDSKLSINTKYIQQQNFLRLLVIKLVVAKKEELRIVMIEEMINNK